MFWYCARPREFFIYIRLFGREREYPNTERWLDEKLEAKIGLGDLTHICASLQFFPTVFRCLKSRFCGKKGCTSISFRYTSEIPSGILGASNLRLIFRRKEKQKQVKGG